MSESKPLDGLTAILVSPTYGGVDPICVRSLRVAVMSASSRGLKWAGDASPDRMTYGLARNVSAAILRKEPAVADGILWVDSDIHCQPDSIIRLLTTARTYKLDFLTGIYHSRKPPNLPVIYHRAENGKYLQCVDYPKETTLSLDACGFGFVWTASNVINRIADSPAFTSKEGWFPDRRDVGGFGEDISFCDLARQAGVQLYVDTGVQVGHSGDTQVIWEADFRARNLTIDSPEIQDRPLEPAWGSK